DHRDLLRRAALRARRDRRVPRAHPPARHGAADVRDPRAGGFRRGQGMSEEPCEILSWDTDFFGVTVARSREPTLTPESWDRAADWCRLNRVRCLYCIVTPDFHTTRILESAGANLVD